MNESQRVCLLDQNAVERALARMARELVEKNGGIMRVESSPGSGSEFTFTIPLNE